MQGKLFSTKSRKAKKTNGNQEMEFEYAALE